MSRHFDVRRLELGAQRFEQLLVVAALDLRRDDFLRVSVGLRRTLTGQLGRPEAEQLVAPRERLEIQRFVRSKAPFERLFPLVLRATRGVC